MNLEGADWQRRVVDRSLKTATRRSIDRGAALVRAAAALLERNGGDRFTVQDVADEAGQSLRTLYQYFESKDDLLLAVFEEAMGTFATLLERSIADLDDPVERLAGLLFAAVRIPQLTDQGINRGLARLRLKLTEVEPELIGRSQAPVATLVRALVADAAGAGAITAIDADQATFLLLSLTTATTTSDTLGNDLGVRPPALADMVSFCLQGLGAGIDAAGMQRIERRLRLPTGDLSLTKASPKPRKRRA